MLISAVQNLVGLFSVPMEFKIKTVIEACNIYPLFILILTKQILNV